LRVYFAILHASLYIVKRITDKELTLAPQLEIVGEESTGRVDYAINSLGMVFYSFHLGWNIEHEQGSPQYSIFRICFEGRIGGRKRFV
jgi:hypothetical protein